MHYVWGIIKSYIKRTKWLCKICIFIYLLIFGEKPYEYIHKERDINRLLERLQKRYKETDRAVYDFKKGNRFIFIGFPFKDCMIEKSVFGDIALGNLEGYDCRFYAARILKHTWLRIFHNIYFLINNYIPLHGKRLWEHAYTTDLMEIPTDKNIFVVFCPGGYYGSVFSQPLLWERLFVASERTFCKRVLYLVDSIDKYPKVRGWFPFFDTVLSHAYGDKKYGVTFYDTPCAKYPASDEEIIYDVYMRASDAGRDSLAWDVFKYLKRRGGNCWIYIHTLDDEKLLRACQEGFVYTSERLAYEEMLKEEMKANVLLEIVVPGVGSGATLRYYEAVMYGKKLLTNNPTVKELSFYDERFIRYFEKPEDIDLEWVKAREKVDYNYNGEFSLANFCRKLEELEKNRETTI